MRRNIGFLIVQLLIHCPDTCRELEWVSKAVFRENGLSNEWFVVDVTIRNQNGTGLNWSKIRPGQEIPLIVWKLVVWVRLWVIAMMCHWMTLLMVQRHWITPSFLKAWLIHYCSRMYQTPDSSTENGIAVPITPKGCGIHRRWVPMGSVTVSAQWP